MPYTDLQRGKMGLCQRIRSCDGPFFLPCGLKSENEKYCEDWKDIPLRRADIQGKGDEISITDKTFKRIKKDFNAAMKARRAAQLKSKEKGGKK